MRLIPFPRAHSGGIGRALGAALTTSLVVVSPVVSPAVKAQAIGVPTVAGTRAVTRADAVASALAQGTTARVGRADTASARAQLTIASARPNPTVSASYTGSAPQLHATVDVPFDLPRLRRLRIAGAQSTLAASRLQFAYTRATVRYDVEVAYGQALAAGERAVLSRQTARDADSLLALVRVQRTAGDASDLDVDLAAINAGNQRNTATADSLAAVVGVLDLQTLMGLPSEQPTITLAESLPVLIASAAGADSTVAARAGITTGQPSIAATAQPLQVAAAAASYQAQEYAFGLARRRNALTPSVQVGVEGRDPTGGPRGPLPLIGVSVPLPLFNRYQGDVALAAADRARAEALLEAARRTAAGAVARARRELALGQVRLDLDRQLLATARTVAAKTLIGYRAGASALPAVLQAQRAVRDAFAQYATDAVTAANAAAAVRLSTATDAVP